MLNSDPLVGVVVSVNPQVEVKASVSATLATKVHSDATIAIALLTAPTASTNAMDTTRHLIFLVLVMASASMERVRTVHAHVTLAGVCGIALFNVPETEPLFALDMAHAPTVSMAMRHVHATACGLLPTAVLATST